MGKRDGNAIALYGKEDGNALATTRPITSFWRVRKPLHYTNITKATVTKAPYNKMSPPKNCNGNALLKQLFSHDGAPVVYLKS